MIKYKNIFAVRFWVAASAVCFGHSTLCFADSVKVISYQGQEIPTPEGTLRIVRYGGPTSLIAPTNGPSGHIVFDSTVSGTGVTSSSNHAIWRYNPSQNSLELVARKGRPSPATGYNWNWFDFPLIDSDGGLAFYATLQSAAGGGSGFWKYTSPSTLLSAFVTSGTASGFFSDGARIQSISLVQYSNNSAPGALSFKTTLSGTGVSAANNLAVWSSTGSAIPHLRTGESRAELGGATINSVDQFQSSSGVSIAWAGLRGTGVIAAPTSSSDRKNDQVIYAPLSTNTLTSRPTLNVLVRAGMPAPQLNQRYFYKLFQGTQTPVANSFGSVAFLASLSDDSNTQTGSAIYAYRNNVLRLVANTGTQAPGLPAGANFLGFNSFSNLNPIALADDSDQSVVFTATASDPANSSSNIRGIWRSKSNDSNPQLLCRSGAPISGIPSDLSLSNISIDKFLVGANGHVVFTATLTGGSVATTNDGVLISVTGNSCRAIAREGDLVDGKIIGELKSGNTYGVNARGQIYVFAVLADPQNPGQILDSLLRIDERGVLRAVAIPGQSLPNQTGTQVEYGTLTANLREGQPILDDFGNLIFISELRFNEVTGAGGAAIVQVHIESEPENACLADYNQSGSVSVDDIFSFLNDWFNRSSQADMDHNGSVSEDDLFAFLQSWYEPCF